MLTWFVHDFFHTLHHETLYAEKMNIEQPINRFVNFCLVENEKVTDHGQLMDELDLVVASTQFGEFASDDKDYSEPPKSDYVVLRSTISVRFPELGFYYTADHKSHAMDSAEVIVGDAVDDLVDIVGDLQKVQWYLKYTSLSNALWYFQFSFRSHWGLHARELQLHLHKHWW